jgi:hypothetical protein
MSDEQIDDVNVDDTPNEPSEHEVEARKFGWVPKDEFKGNEDDWRDADEFLRRGREINGYLRKDLDKLARQNAAKEAELLEIKQTLKEFKEFYSKAEENAYKRAVKELQEQRAEAIKNNDGDLVIELEEQLEELKEQKPVRKEQKEEVKPNTPPPEFFDWVEENQWYRDDRALQGAAVAISEELRERHPSLFGREFLDLVAKEVKKNFPDKFKSKTRDSVPAVEGGNTNRGTGKKKTFADLPAEAKEACLRFEKQKLITREEYVSQYFAE